MMELNKKKVIAAFKSNFSYEIAETPLGTAVKMPSKEAFIFSAVTGAGYLDNPVYPFTPRGLLKLFYNAFDYNFVSGIFDNLSIKHTPYILSLAKPFLFDDKYKYIVPIEFNSEIELQKLLKSKFDKIEKPAQYLILRIESSKKGNGMEPFMEFLAAEYFKEQGFIVENQIPLAHSLGSPDFGGYALDETFDSLKEYGILCNGFHIIELALLRIKPNATFQDKPLQGQLIVGEAKTSTKMMTTQLEKYLNTGLFDKGFEIHPQKTHPDKDSFGLITLDESYKIRCTEPRISYSSGSNLSKEKYVNWLNNYMKFYLLANLTNDEFGQYYMQFNDHPISSKEDIVAFITGQTTRQILKFLHTIFWSKKWRYPVTS